MTSVEHPQCTVISSKGFAGHRSHLLRHAANRCRTVGFQRSGGIVTARIQNFAYLNTRPRQHAASNAPTRPTTKVVPELSNLLPFLSAWGALILSEGAGLSEWTVLLNLTWGAMASVAAGILLEKLKIESKPIQMRLDNGPSGIRRGGRLPMKDLVRAADGSVEGLKALLRREWELPEDTLVNVYGIDYDGAEFEFTPMVAHDLKGSLSGSQAVLLRVMAPVPNTLVNAHSNGYIIPAHSTQSSDAKN